MKKWYLVSIFMLCLMLANGADSNYVRTFFLGNTEVSTRTTCFKNCEGTVSFINLHDDENTSVEAALIFLAQRGGKLTQLQHTGKRIIAFAVEKDTVKMNSDSSLNYPLFKRTSDTTEEPDSFMIDPNRIFTEEGRQATLMKYGRFSPEAENEVELFANDILQNYVEGKRMVVSLHNNTEKALSINSYRKGGTEQRNAEKVYINPLMDPDDFILTTEASVFEKLKERRINVALQNNASVTDDGSLSVYAAARKIPYINVEAQHGHVAEQLRMLKALEDIILEQEISLQ